MPRIRATVAAARSAVRRDIKLILVVAGFEDARIVLKVRGPTAMPPRVRTARKPRAPAARQNSLRMRALEIDMIHRLVLCVMVFVCAGCASNGGAAPIENIEWRLARFGATPAVIANPQNPPRLTLQAADHRVTGSGGCNGMGGSYELEGDRLEFGQMIGTMMACPQGMEQERAFHQALAKVKRWRLNGATLELLDESSQPVLALERKN
jgi:heat shock protein HslJ